MCPRNKPRWASILPVLEESRLFYPPLSWRSSTSGRFRQPRRPPSVNLWVPSFDRPVPSAATCKILQFVAAETVISGIGTYPLCFRKHALFGLFNDPRRESPGNQSLTLLPPVFFVTPIRQCRIIKQKIGLPHSRSRFLHHSRFAQWKSGRRCCYQDDQESSSTLLLPLSFRRYLRPRNISRPAYRLDTLPSRPRQRHRAGELWIDPRIRPDLL